ncbi:MAG: EF-P beta-lysylation protein EpmB [Gammaproteobacteria bacterium]|uniref:EF-P beta-lysylation protein EpmB n=1 Tax=Vreelandella venusta TaxID=44935 RepID=UPI0018DAF2DA|nr:EF-P beta-lysylation protein EpmB [Halomonas venusta]MBR9924194.1 EF-P beta-lysylation protein EpmB [Gammaproteobacteria bacterium]MDW0359909.1 EF-P beta-lysylation protein EpmB [Halomonas venusta]MDX1354113.1 EF-P beta-lysylation protein EpmB [Halomonas venusta]MDX1713861.1 EF-P beta-lysylation protein EpmB [Halomonas venusta]QPI62788.1 EF-P beta-lysylation protein EpmB [Halomonas venusta]
MQENIIIADKRQSTQIYASWQRQLSQAIRDPATLCKRLNLDDSWLPGAATGHQLFEICVPDAYLTRIAPNDPNDPLLRQVLPVSDEAATPQGYVTDPLEEAEHQPVKGLIHKYANRVLLIASPNCAINCRYCFRRHFPYSDNSPSRAQWQEALDYLRIDTSLNEAILSGGDPLAANDRQLAWLVEQLENIPHLKRLRIHTRLPVVIPDRIDDALVGWLAATRLQKVMVLHINHANEIDQAVINACTRLKQAGVTLLNQSVLLRGINDSVSTLATLSERLFEAGVLPYYLHVVDPVQGAAHFDVPDAEAKALVKQLLEHLPGFLMPRLVREVPGKASKTPL